MLEAATRGIPFLLVLLATAVDLRTRRVPNALIIPALALGLVARFPPDPWTFLPVWLFVLAAWRAGIVGGGDAKLWMALAMWTPPVGFQALVAAGLSAALTGALFLGLAGIRQILRRQPLRGLFGVLRPAAWQALPYALWLAAGAPAGV